MDDENPDKQEHQLNPKASKSFWLAYSGFFPSTLSYISGGGKTFGKHTVPSLTPDPLNSLHIFRRGINALHLTAAECRSPSAERPYTHAYTFFPTQKMYPAVCHDSETSIGMTLTAKSLHLSPNIPQRAPQSIQPQKCPKKRNPQVLNTDSKPEALHPAKTDDESILNCVNVLLGVRRKTRTLWARGPSSPHQ